MQPNVRDLEVSYFPSVNAVFCSPFFIGFLGSLDTFGARCRERSNAATVRRCLYDRLGADFAAAARPVLDNELLSMPLREPPTAPVQMTSIVGNRGSAVRQSHK